ncbi:MAG: PEP-CTERM sorting domain-containing protein [Verrucomicrobiae bacterium]
MKAPIAFFALIGGICFVAQSASGKSTPVVWSAAATISSDSDVSTSGTLVYAYNIGPAGTPATTVNGVTFSSFEFPPDGTNDTVRVGDLEFSDAPEFLNSSSDFGSGGSPFTDLSANYQTLLGSGGHTSNPATMIVWLYGLIPTQDYLVEIWVSNSAGKPLFLNTQASGSTPVSLSSTSGDLGQFATGTFTAEYSTGAFLLTASGGSLPMLNAVQLRAVPEPSTWLLLGLGFAASVAACLRRRNAQGLGLFAR